MAKASRVRRYLPVSTCPPPPVASYMEEPALIFAHDMRHVDPKAGLASFGPYSWLPDRRHPGRIRLGIIGTAQTIAAVRSWVQESARGVTTDKVQHPSFPGFAPDRGFFTQLEFDDAWNQLVSSGESSDLLRPQRRQRERFEAALDLLETKLRLLSEQDSVPDYVVICLPDDLLEKVRVADYTDATEGRVQRNLRRALKARAMRFRLPTQLLRMQTMDGRDPTPRTKIAWNFFTGAYVKAGGIPWAPVGLPPGTCYVGISFFRPLGAASSTLQTSLVQAFDEHGHGLVLRGHDVEWDPDTEGTRSPHLTEEQAAALIELVLQRYSDELHQTPRRVVLHKTSRYWAAERAGFEAALRGRVSRWDLVALQGQSQVRLIPANRYPPLRGTCWRVGEIDYLYTTGYVSALGEYHGLHVPSPLRIADHIGHDTSREDLLREILVLTKLNWNSAQLGGLMPITLRFSDRVGEILREFPRDREPLPQYKYYM